LPTLVDEWPAEGLERVESCPLCSETRRQLLYEDLTDRSYRSAPGRWSLFRCASCHSAYLDPRPNAQTASLAYKTYYAEAPHPWPTTPPRGWHRLRRGLRNGYLNARYCYHIEPAIRAGRFLVPLLPRHRSLADEHVRHLRLPENAPRLLDVGCGEGEFLAEMQSLGWSVSGIDPSEEAVATARARGVPARHGTLSEGTLEPASLDAITFRLVFEHLRNPFEVLAECRRGLKSEGMLWIATPSLDAEAHRVFGRNWIHLEPPRHAVVYTRFALSRALSAFGFDVVDVRPLRQASWSFRLSAALARGLPPFEHAPPLPLWLRAHAMLADLKAVRRPESADVVVVIARRR
jgi:2-polyprenyl-3-methyl-5-hydroxy-6-metoxy-1,4-benzoquinol methylase